MNRLNVFLSMAGRAFSRNRRLAALITTVLACLAACRDPVQVPTQESGVAAPQKTPEVPGIALQPQPLPDRPAQVPGSPETPEGVAFQAFLARYGRPAPDRDRLREWAREQVDAIQKHLQIYPESSHACQLRHWQVVNLIDVLGDFEQARSALVNLDDRLRNQEGDEAEALRGRALRLRIRLHHAENNPAQEARAIHQLLPALEGLEAQVMIGRLFELECLAPGCVLPGFEGYDLKGDRVTSAQGRGRVMILDFWDPAAPGCVEDFLDRQHLQRVHGEHDLVLVGVPLCRSKTTLLAFLNKVKARWIQLYDSGRPGNDHPVARQFTPTGRPAAFLIDRKGVIRARDLRGAVLRQRVEQLIREAVDSPE